MVFDNKNIKAPTLRRDLKTRHLTMIAIGGSIGTGLFVASGTVISLVGPIGALFSYILIGVMVYFLMTSLSELAAYIPVSGSFSIYGQEYVEEGFGFALGWNYWYNWAITIAVDLVAAQLVMTWWFPNTPGWIWSILFLMVIFLLNYVSVRSFGEAEYWFSIIKIATVIVFIIIGFAMIIGVFQSRYPIGWHNWKISNIPIIGNFSEIINVAMIVGFSFQGTELIGIASGESKNPEKSVPRAVRQVFWRILIFYIFTILLIILIIPYPNSNLLCKDIKEVIVSPFTLVFQQAGLLSASSVMNAVILITALSAGNSGMYVSSRMLYTLACNGKAPRIFSKLSCEGIPRNALYATTTIAGLCFLTSIFSKQKVYLWLLNTSSVTGFIAWIGISISHYRFRRGYVLQGNNTNNLPYRSLFFPIGPIFSFVLSILIIFGQNYQIFFSKSIDWSHIIATYIGIPIFLVIWFSYKLAKGTHFIRYCEMKFPGSCLKRSFD